MQVRVKGLSHRVYRFAIVRLQNIQNLIGDHFDTFKQSRAGSILCCRFDCAIQIEILRRCGIEVESVALAHINKHFIYPGASNYLERYMHPFFLFTPLWLMWLVTRCDSAAQPKSIGIAIFRYFYALPPRWIGVEPASTPAPFAFLDGWSGPR